MGHQKNGRTIGIPQLQHLPDDLRLGGHIQCAGRLIRQQELWLEGHGHSDAHPLALTSAELKGIGTQNTLRV